MMVGVATGMDGVVAVEILSLLADKSACGMIVVSFRHEIHDFIVDISSFLIL